MQASCSLIFVVMLTFQAASDSGLYHTTARKRHWLQYPEIWTSPTINMGVQLGSISNVTLDLGTSPWFRCSEQMTRFSR
jgi:hypothetical protein